MYKKYYKICNINVHMSVVNVIRYIMVKNVYNKIILLYVEEIERIYKIIRFVNAKTFFTAILTMNIVKVNNFY